MIKYLSRGARGFATCSRAVLPALLALALSGCSLSGPSRASLGEEAAAQIQAPDSTLLAAGGTDHEQTPEGDIPAITWRRYGVDLPWEDIRRLL